MLQMIKALTEKMRANVEHRGHLAETLEAMGWEIETLKDHVAGLAHEATGETGAAVAALGGRLDSLTSAVSGVGELVTALTSRVAALEAAPAPAPHLQAPYDPANAGQQSQQA